MNEAELRRRLPSGLAHNHLAPGGHRLAAVLIPLEPERGVWLTRRSALLPNHAGQVSFPGGMIEAYDESVEAAALREAKEEIGLDPAQAEILGRMDDFVTGTGFHISPVIALVPRNVAFVATPDEVQDIFCLPFDVLLDNTLPKLRLGSWRGQMHEFVVWPHETQVIWGATAKILLNLALRLREEA
jgi:8-oxo-dGTP pyrophosphatase MutT (NUDIX family)